MWRYCACLCSAVCFLILVCGVFMSLSPTARLLRLYSPRGRIACLPFVLTVAIFFWATLGVGFCAGSLASVGTSWADWSIYSLFAALLFASPILICAYIKRLHDIGLSGWWLLINVPPVFIIGYPHERSIIQRDVFFCFLIFCAAMPRQKRDNKYGAWTPEPYDAGPETSTKA